MQEAQEMWVQSLGWADAWRGSGDPLQDSCPENAADRGSRQVTQPMGPRRVRHDWAHKTSQDFPGGSVVKNPPADAGDTGSIPGVGRSPGEGNGNPL